MEGGGEREGEPRSVRGGSVIEGGDGKTLQFPELLV